jgi:hypothetical protein
MTEYNSYYILHLTKAGQERLGLETSHISVWDYFQDKEATELDGRLWYKARLNDENLFLHIRHDEIKTSEEKDYIPTPTYTPSNTNNSCFIATACSANLDELGSLYNFRDRYLVDFSLGRKFIDFYYAFSPPIADVIRDSTVLKLLTLHFFVKPIVLLINLFFVSNR